jgi:hypothetical protein
MAEPIVSTIYSVDGMRTDRIGRLIMAAVVLLTLLAFASRLTTRLRSPSRPKSEPSAPHNRYGHGSGMVGMFWRCRSALRLVVAATAFWLDVGHTLSAGSGRLRESPSMHRSTKPRLRDRATRVLAVQHHRRGEPASRYAAAGNWTIIKLKLMRGPRDPAKQ